MESDISELIETAAPTDNEEEEEDIIPVESVDEGRKDSRMDKVINRSIPVPEPVPVKNKPDHGKGCCGGDRDHQTNKQ